MSINYLGSTPTASPIVANVSEAVAAAKTVTNPLLQFDSPLDIIRIPFRLAYLLEKLIIWVFKHVASLLGLGAVWRGVVKIGDALWMFIAGPTAVEVGGAAVASTSNWDKFWDLFGLQSVRNLGGLFTYFTSRWAFACFTVVSNPLLWPVSPVSRSFI